MTRFLLIALSLIAAAAMQLPCLAAAPQDMGAAMEYCDRTALARPEGVWEFPDDRTRVLIMSSGSPYSYDIIVISSPDCRLDPGQKIGEIREEADENKFRLSLYSNFKGNLLTDMRHCSAEIDSQASAIRIHPRKFKITLRNASRLLPQFWRIFNLRVSDPLEKLPVGMIRIYPSYDGNGSSSRNPRYL